jgi:apolipoprotein N-acyltransferase
MNNLKMPRDYYTIAVILGALATLGFAPFNITVLIVFSFSIIYVFLSEDITKKQSFLIGIWFGLAHFSTSLYWFSFALATDIYKFGWLIPFAVFGLSLFFSIYFGLAFLIFKVCRYKNPIIFSVIITFFEFLRGTLFTGFPWNLIGYTWDSLEILQFSSLFGIYGLTFLTLFLSGSIGALLLKNNKSNLIYCGFTIFILISIYMYGYFRLENNKTEYSDTRIRVVQANILHQAEWNEDYAYKVINKYLSLTTTQGLEHVDYVIWPESSLPFLLSKDSENIPNELSKVIPNMLIAGGNRLEDNKIFNSIFIIKQGKIVDYYDKVKLVPFGEYVPFKKFIPIKKIVNGLFDFSQGKGSWQWFESGRQRIESFDIIPTICYEDIFTGGGISISGQSKWIVNLTNDSWFGVSTEPYQHHQMARVRAIEFGLPLVRSTTTGISAVFDSYGRIIKKIDLQDEGIIDVNLPKRSGNTAYFVIQVICIVFFYLVHSLYEFGMIQDYLFLFWIILAIAYCIILFRKLRKRTFYSNVKGFFFLFLILFSMFYSYANISNFFIPLGVLLSVLYCILLVNINKNNKIS